MTDAIIGKEPFVAFVGAGASAIPPSRLPTWVQFNNLLLECLCDRLAEYSRNRQPTQDMLTLFRARRDHTRFFAPDFQAQLIEEQIGADYFRVWQSLATDVCSPVHTGLAELASRGRLAAIITTNFDELIETALRTHNVEYDVYCDRDTFGQLASRLNANRMSRLPVIKIHGTLSQPESLIDTLKQRLAGRPPSMEAALQILLRRHRWLFLGFSGADFSYNPRYLGILDAADEAKGFVFLAREGSAIEEGVNTLVRAYEPSKARIEYGDLSTWLSRTFGLTAAEVVPGQLESEEASQLRVMKAIREWVSQLGPMAVVNIIYAMMKSSGVENDALWLLRKTWKSYRTPDDTAGPSYARYNYNYGLALLDKGFISNPVALAEDMSNLPEWREYADRNAYEYLARGYTSGNILPAGAHVASVLAYRGEVGKSIGVAAAITDEAIAQDAKQDLCDIAIASTVVYDIIRLFEPAVGQLQQCAQIARELGDEPRRAVLCAHLGRFLTYSGAFEEADAFIREAEGIGQRLDLQPALLNARAARARWLTDSGTSDQEAITVLVELIETVHQQDDVPVFTKVDLLQPDAEPVAVRGRTPLLCRLLLDLNRAAFFTGNADLMNQTLDELDELAIVHFLGYCPHYYLAHAQCSLEYGDGDHLKLAADLIGRARQVGEEQGNPWVAQEAARLEGLLKQ